MTAYNVELINGISFGIQYIDNYEDEQGTWFIVILELGLFRVMLYWEK